MRIRRSAYCIALLGSYLSYSHAANGPSCVTSINRINRVLVALSHSTSPRKKFHRINAPLSYCTMPRTNAKQASKRSEKISETQSSAKSKTKQTKRKLNTLSSIAARNASTSNNAKVAPLLDLGTLIEGIVIKRPSSTIKSPYVADVQLAHAGPIDPVVLAHAPALDVGGLCSPGSTVLMKARSPGGKTTHSIELVLADGPNGEEGAVLVGAHPRLAEELADEVLRRGLLEDYIGFAGASFDAPATPKKKSPKRAKGKNAPGDVADVDHEHMKPGIYIKRQITCGDSRVDFELSRVEEEAQKATHVAKKALIEIKNVVCSDYFPTHAPEKKNSNHCAIINAEVEESQYKRNAIFPWGRVGQEFEGRKVVSTRAIKHLRNLVDLGKDKAVQPIVLFVVNRSDCEVVRACHEQCPMFAEELTNAHMNGVLVKAFRVRWSKDGKAYFDGIVPVNL
mmetsp:Transcript_17547/g.38129  ORF Transcript_17547/g.38129 Transcript_17547/m.38129 type:complete len:452 (+) Transcript_17547:105-1460(+)